MKAILNFFNKINRRNYSTLAGAIAFFFIVNGGSIVFLTLIFLKYFNIEITLNTGAEVNQLERIGLYIYETSKSLTASYSFFFVLTSIWSSSTLFFHLIKTGEFIYDFKRKKYGLITRIGSIILVLVFLVLLLCCVILFLILAYLSQIIKIKLIFKIIQILLGIIVPFTIVVYFNLLVPPVRIPFKKQLKGSLFTILFWIIATIGFLIYIKVFVNFKVVYGTLTFVIIFMLWIYLLSQGLIIGLMINYENWLKLKV